jgi:hypothetical protein
LQSAENLASAIGRVFVDQRLEAKVFAQRIPCRIELELWYRDAVWHPEQMIEQAKRFVVFSDADVDFGKSSSNLGPIVTLRFRCLNVSVD